MKKLGISIMIIVACLLSIPKMYAQYQITGRIMQEGKEIPMEFANITLDTADSVFVTGTTTDMKGVFLLKNVESGNYLITASYMGFTSQTIALNGLSKSIHLDDIYLEEKTSELDAVSITASNAVNKTDRLILFVTRQQKQNSSNGINLLNTMQLPRLTVNPIMNEVSLPGEGTIQFCINGVIVSASDIQALQPNEVIRIEYLDNPGVRYGDADIVINYILKRERTGGSISMDLGNAITTSFGDDQLAAKFNYKKSEFGLNYAVRYRNPTHLWGDEERTFHFSDGNSMKRFSDGIPGHFTENAHNLSLNYNLLDDGKYYFNATFRHAFSKEEKIRYSSQYASLKTENITNTYQGSNGIQRTPSVDLYYMRSLKNKQNMIVNIVGTYINSQINQKYEEKKEEVEISNIISDVKGDKYSIIGEAIYEKTTENGDRFTAGIKHTHAFANNDYTGTINSQTKMDQADSYLYAEYAGKKDKFSYIGGVGLSRSWAKQKGENDYTFYTFRPKLTLQYDFTRSMFLRLKGDIFNATPSLSRLSDIDQHIDTLRIMRGNPDLKPNINYQINLLYSWKKGIYGVDFYNLYLYSPNPIMEETLRENDKFIYTYNNHKNWQKLNSELTLKAGPIKKILLISLTGGINHFISNGNEYRHTYTNLYYRLQMMAMYRKFTGILQATSADDHFAGETIHGGENSHLGMLTYNAGKFTIGAGVMLPFSDQYKRYTENRNVYNPSKLYAYANDFSRMILLKFSWNFDYGRKAKGGSKRINNEDTDSGIMRNN